MLVFAYLCGLVLAALCTFFAGRRLCVEPIPPSQSVVFSILTGALWPLLVLGALEIGSLALLLKVALRVKAASGGRRPLVSSLSFVAEH